MTRRRVKLSGWWPHLHLWLPPLAYMVLVFHLSSQSNPLPVLTEHVWDKALHCSEYGGLAFLLCRALRGEGLGWPAALSLAFTATSVYGATDEWHQLYTPGRSADVHDWMADTVGAAIGLGSYVAIARMGSMLARLRPGKSRSASE